MFNFNWSYSYHYFSNTINRANTAKPKTSINNTIQSQYQQGHLPVPARQQEQRLSAIMENISILAGLFTN